MSFTIVVLFLAFVRFIIDLKYEKEHVSEQINNEIKILLAGLDNDNYQLMGETYNKFQEGGIIYATPGSGKTRSILE